MCRYCEELREADVLEDDEYTMVIMEGPDIEFDSPECNISGHLEDWRHPYNPEVAPMWFLSIAIEEGWDVKVPVRIGSPYSGRYTEAEYKAETGFECEELASIRFCPFCGRNLEESE